MVDFARSSGGIDYSLQKAEEFASKARSCILSFPNSAAKHSLLQFIDFVLKRSS
jgi:geranylgeranyl pyrophosphate synthase